MKFNISTLVLVVVGSALASQADEPFYLQDGDRVVFYGDSITDQRLYTTFTESYVVTRFPKLNVTFVHSGWGGDRVTGGGGGSIDVRLERDVFAYKPTVMTIMLGMNDGSYRAFDHGIFDQFSRGYERIVDSLKNRLPNLKLTVIEPSPYDDITQPAKFDGGYNSVLIAYGQFVQDLGQRSHARVADLNAPVITALQKAKATDADLAKKFIPDRVHPGEAGHLLMAAALLRSWGAPAVVTDVEISVSEKKAVKSKSTKVWDVKGSEDLSWVQLDEALPAPIDMTDAVIALAVRSSDFVRALDTQRLKVTGLSGSNYKLMIDGSSVGEFTRDQLEEGINLSTVSTPMVKQALDVHKLTLDHNKVHFTRWRQIQVPLANSKSDRVQSAVKELMTALDDEEAAVVKAQRAAAQPVEHRYQLTRS